MKSLAKKVPKSMQKLSAIFSWKVLKKIIIKNKIIIYFLKLSNSDFKKLAYLTGPHKVWLELNDKSWGHLNSWNSMFSPLPPFPLLFFPFQKKTIQRKSGNSKTKVSRSDFFNNERPLEESKCGFIS